VRDSVHIPSRFNGPLESGNGGYSAGVVIGAIGVAAVFVLGSVVIRLLGKLF